MEILYRATLGILLSYLASSILFQDELRTWF